MHKIIIIYQHKIIQKLTVIVINMLTCTHGDSENVVVRIRPHTYDGQQTPALRAKLGEHTELIPYFDHSLGKYLIFILCFDRVLASHSENLAGTYIGVRQQQQCNNVLISLLSIANVNSVYHL